MRKKAKQSKRIHGYRKRKVILEVEKEKSGFKLRSFQLAQHGKGGLVARLLVRSMSSLSSSLFLSTFLVVPLSSLFIPHFLLDFSPSLLLPSPVPRSLPLSFSPLFVCCIAHTRHGAACESYCHLCKRPSVLKSLNSDKVDLTRTYI